MYGQRTIMGKLTLRLKHLGFSERNIARTAGVSRNTVKRVVEAATAAKIDWTHAESMDDATIEMELFPDRKNAQPCHSICDLHWKTRRGIATGYPIIEFFVTV